MSLASAVPGERSRIGESAAVPPETGEHVLRYALGLEDALAWERVSPQFRRRDRLALIVSVFAGLAVLQFGGSHLDILPGLHRLPVAVLVLLTLPVIVRLLQLRDRRHRARDRVGDGVEVVLEVRDDRLVERRADRSGAVALGARSLRDIREGPGHVFLATREDVIIVPKRALGDASATRAFVARWRARAA